VSGGTQRWAAHTARDWQLLAASEDGYLFGIDLHSRVYEIQRDVARPLFRVAPKPESFAVLGDGRFVFSGPSNGKLIHLYSPQGRWLKSFGDVKTFTRAGPRQNQWLNQGRVLVGPQDTIHYVFLNSPEPSYVTFSRDGEVLGEHAI
jgi:hypothetical protein